MKPVTTSEANGRVDNATFARHDPEFRQACEAAGVKPTKRQASHYRRKLGAAYKCKHALIAGLTEGGAQ